MQMKWTDVRSSSALVRGLRIVSLVLIWLSIIYVLGPEQSSVEAEVNAEIRSVEGEIALLRVHDVGTGFGPPSDFLDAEVIVQLENVPGRAFGFQLRTDSQAPAREGMLEVLRTGFNSSSPVRLDFIDEGSSNSVMVRAVVMPQEEEFKQYLPHIRR
jgi:hypothetical protein